MPVEDEGFYNILGDEVTRTSLVQLMIDYYQEKLEIGESKITDFNEGSEIRNLLEAFAVDIYNVMEDQNDLSSIAFIETADGEWLDKHGAMPNINLPRDTGQEAEGFVEFKIPNSAESEVIIPGETILTCEENDLDYQTNEDGVISVGETTVTVSATCLTTGEDGNCSKNTLNTISDESLNILGLEVTNPEAFEYGTDYEEDEEYRARLLEYERKDDFGSLPYYEELAMKVDGVHDVYITDKTSGFTKTVIFNTYEKPISDDILLDLTETFTNVNNIIIDHLFKVEKASVQKIALRLYLYTNDADTIEKDMIMEFLRVFFNGGDADQGTEYEGLSIGESMRKEQIQSVLEVFDDITSIGNIDYKTQSAWVVNWESVSPEDEYTVFDFDAENTIIYVNDVII